MFFDAALRCCLVNVLHQFIFSFVAEIQDKNANICYVSECMSGSNDPTIAHADARKTTENFVPHFFESLWSEASKWNNCCLRKCQRKSGKVSLWCMSGLLQCVTTLTFVKTDQIVIVFSPRYGYLSFRHIATSWQNASDHTTLSDLPRSRPWLTKVTAHRR